MNQLAEKPQAAKAVHTSIYAALAAAQADMGPVLKENVNPAFKSRYADLSSVVAACLPALNAHGIAVFQPMREIEGKRYVVTILAHENGEVIENPVELIVGKNDMQGLGSAMTYARRYGLMAMAGVAPEDDDGNAAVVAAPRQEQRQQTRQEPPRNQGPPPWISQWKASPAPKPSTSLLRSGATCPAVSRARRPSLPPRMPRNLA